MALLRRSVRHARMPTLFCNTFTQKRALSSDALERVDLAEILDKLRPIGAGEVTLDRTGDREARIRVQNPGRKNAFSGKMMAELHDAVARLAKDEQFKQTTTLYVEGTDDFFCSGADLGVLKDHFTRNDGLRMSWLMQRTLHSMRSLPQISVAVIQGGAVGGGTEFALSCDFRVFQHDANFQMVQTKLGLIPGWGGGSRLVRLLGRQKSIEVLCGAKKLTSHECLALGLADKVSEPGQPAKEAAEAFMKSYASATYPQAVQHCKSLISFVDDQNEMEKCLELERAIFAKVWQGEENKDALSKISLRSKTNKK